ncbi:cell envelope integrity protein CreD [Edaphobacter flagellatus]|uniref:cell envelope integrity protein CreD n=1 Tax=Edaphobacter flagellatus TaxID=1933044 RepID=UPI0021B2C71D|nr:cell envelope integrity protein CreD [Edaphobacter flagellatus]
MIHLSLDQPGSTLRPSSRSMGFKLIIVCTLALLMCIPSFFVSDLVRERTQRADEVVKDISANVGGHQVFLGPTLAIPYQTPPQNPADTEHYGTYLVFPAQASGTVTTVTEERHRSLFRVPVFQADLKLDADFDLTGVPAAAPSGATFDWSRAEIVVGASDSRGALADANLTAADTTSTLVPANIAEHLSFGDPDHATKLTVFGAKASSFAMPNAKFHASATLRFSGAERIAVLAYGKTTRLTAQGDWRNPGFYGILPTSHSIYQNGFSATWSVPFIGRGVRAEGPSGSITGLNATELGVNFVEVADPYQSVNRALKYILLLLGLVFLSYFIFEVTTGKRVHPAQYLLVGVAQIIFYLLLLSLAERIGFGPGYVIAGGATVLLLAANAGWIFASRLQAARAFVSFSLLYGLIYLLLTLEDNALLVGAIASFLAVAAVMYFTRRIDWYSSLPGASSASPVAPPPPPANPA